jgi:hypothetical protein
VTSRHLAPPRFSCCSSTRCCIAPPSSRDQHNMLKTSFKTAFNTFDPSRFWSRMPPGDVLRPVSAGPYPEDLGRRLEVIRHAGPGRYRSPRHRMALHRKKRGCNMRVTGGRAKAWCLPIHAETSVSLSPPLSLSAKSVSMTWRAVCVTGARQKPAAASYTWKRLSLFKMGVTDVAGNMCSAMQT